MQHQALLDKRIQMKPKKIPLNFIAYTFGYSKKLNVSTQSEFLKKLKFGDLKQIN